MGVAALAPGPTDRFVFNRFASQLATIGRYVDGAASVIGRQRVGAYGGYWVIKYLIDNRKIV